ncbi:MAG: sugar ABC transporter substrate-binding protein [Microbacterium sp.]|jgi:ribose transport system substrate-binding protein|uniref:sugar ABC transporter substrate-binding protein n=1 Tax=Microbacterium sp. TaxID=51671 RepID=UPI0028312DAE|nr:sugar ABC transporter substrate-binding protein [Microbacterium sp.]MDR2321430.1 sugar ABC transporter substrate-binding protein [Microbacterium sp.]
MTHLSRIIAGAGVVALGVSLAACSSGSGSGGSGGDTYSIVFLASSSQNGYNQAVYEGVQKEAKDLEKKFGITITTKIQDGQFDANTQLSQLQNAGTTGQASGIIVVPQDGPGLAAAFPLGNDVPVVSVLNPIGPDIDKMTPQIEGVVSTVASSPSEGAARQAQTVVDYCKNIDPCKIGLVAGLLNSPLDVARIAAWKKVLGQSPNIQIVGTVEGAYDRDKSLTAVSNLLQANKDINGILSNADQQTQGAQIALENAGIDPSKIFLTGGGGTTEAVKAVRDGKWTNDYLNYPVSMGKAALEQLVNKLRGEKVQAVVDADSLVKIGPMATKKDLDAVPDFTGEWNG